jgi:hypothetical protein
MASGALLRVLCLHGSRQDGEIFSQRLEVLRRKLAGIVVSLLSAQACVPCSLATCSLALNPLPTGNHVYQT